MGSEAENQTKNSDHQLQSNYDVWPWWSNWFAWLESPLSVRVSTRWCHGRDSCLVYFSGEFISVDVNTKLCCNNFFFFAADVKFAEKNKSIEEHFSSSSWLKARSCDSTNFSIEGRDLFTWMDCCRVNLVRIQISFFFSFLLAVELARSHEIVGHGSCCVQGRHCKRNEPKKIFFRGWQPRLSHAAAEKRKNSRLCWFRMVYTAVFRQQSEGEKQGAVRSFKALS